MLTVEIDFLASRFGATAFDDRTSAEWPPHPARLFSAMVAAWADTSSPDGDEEAALRWFEALEPPSIRCAGESEISRRSIVTHYVPVNDCRVTTRDVSGLYNELRQAQSDFESATDDRAAARASKALARTGVKVRRDSRAVGAAAGDVSPTVREGGLAVLPDLRGRQGRTFPVIRLSEAVSAVRFRWASAEPDRAVADALDRVLGRVGRLGHSSTPVSCRLSTRGSDGGGDTLVTWQVIGEGDTLGEGDPPVMVRVPAPGLFDRLAVQFAEDGGSRPRVAPARFVPYGPSSRATVTPATSLLAGSWRVLAIRRGGRVRLTRTLDLSRAVRGALLSGCDDAPPYVLHGHTPGAPGSRTAPGLQPHLSILPLANVGSRFGDGVVHGVALVLPRRASSEDRDAVDKAVRRWRTRGQDGVMPLRMHNLAVELEDRGFDSTAQGDPVQTTVLTRRYWSRVARRWTSITPIALDRYPGRLNEPGWEERAAETIAMACVHLGLPSPAEVELLWGPPLAGVPAAGPNDLARQQGARFPGFRAGTSDQVRLCVHARLTFADAIRGPLVVGAGRFAGYGLCLPTERES